MQLVRPEGPGSSGPTAASHGTDAPDVVACRDVALAGPRAGVRRTRWWIEVGAAVVVALAYLVGPRSVPRPEVVAGAEARSWWLYRLEQRLHLDVELGLQAVLDEVGLLVPVNWAYGTLHFAVTAAVLVHLYRRRPASYERWRTAFVVSSVAAFLFARRWPVAPPRLLVGTDGTPLLTDTLLEHSAPWTFHSGAMSEVANQYAAMPSMHAGWALFCALALGCGRSAGVRALLLLYPLMVTVVIMASGNHFLLDAVGGFVVVGLGVAAVWSAARLPRLGRRAVS